MMLRICEVDHCQSSASAVPVQTIVEGLGWPTSKPESSAGAQQWHTSPVLRGSSQRSAEDELKYQTLTLQVVSWQSNQGRLTAP